MTSTNTASFANNSGKTVLVLSGMSDSSTSPQQGYEQTLTLLTFEGGATTLESGKQSTLNLPAGQVISNLLVSDPATLFPVASIGEGPDYSVQGNWPPPNKPIVVTADDVTAMNQALQFRQNIMASPSSSTAVAFQGALQQAQSAGTAEDILNQMSAFFQKQPSYSKVSYPGYAAVESYLKTFALSWTQKNEASGSNNGATYYIYSEPDAGKAGADSLGTIQATRKTGGSGNADPTDHMSGYSITLISTDGGTTVLSYAGGAFSDTTGAVALNASYAYAGRFTGKISDVRLWPVLVGTIQSKNVIAVPLEPESAIGKWWSQQSFSSMFKLFMDAMGLWMALDFLKTKLSSKKETLEKDKAENKGENPTEDQQKQADQTADTASQADAQDSTEQAKKISGDENFEVPTDDSAIGNLVDSTRGDSKSALQEVATDNTKGAIEDTGNTLEDIAKIEVTPEIEQAGENLNKAGESLQNGDISAANDSLQSANTELSTAVENLGNQISTEQKEAFNNEIEANKEAAEEAKNTDEEGDKSGEGDDPEGDGFPIEE